jgi:Dienelactone hydrolase and related enzymes
MIKNANIPNDNGFLTSLDQLKALFAEGCRQRFTGKTTDELVKWQTESRELFRNILGFKTFKPCDNKLFELETEVLEDYTRIKYVLQTEELVYVPFYALIPADIKPGEKRPAMICPQGHFTRAKESVAAVRHEAGVNDDIEKFNLNYGEDFAKMGYIAFCPDARGFGERCEKYGQPDGRWKCTCQQLNRMGIPLGRCAIGMSVWDLTKLCDYICTRPDCDTDRIGCAGLSGGGLQTLYFTAVDERIKCACTSGYFYGAMESLLEMNGNCDCNYVPNLWTNFDMGDIGALIAPRALIIESGLRDDLNGKSGIENVKSQYVITKKAYDIYGAEDKLARTQFDGEHLWCGKDVYPFFEKNL